MILFLGVITFFIFTLQYSLATNNMMTSVMNPKNMTYIVIFANKSIIDVDDKNRYVLALLGSNLEGIINELARGINLHPTTEEYQDINITIDE